MEGDSDGAFEQNLKIVLNKLNGVSVEETSMVVVHTSDLDPFLFYVPTDSSFIDPLVGKPYFVASQGRFALREFVNGYDGSSADVAVPHLACEMVSNLRGNCCIPFFEQCKLTCHYYHFVSV